jgi:type II secretory pathway pseudopilin PulG
MRSRKGFTLVELLVVSGISIIITTTIVAILFIVLRGSKKSDSIVVVRQNGEQAMAQMVRIMRFAKSLDDTCPLPDDKSVTITAADASQTVYAFTCPLNPPPNFIGLNGAKLTNDATVVVDSCSFVCTQQAGSSPTIGISFILSKKNLSGLPEENSRIPFKSSVTLRNIGGQ